MYALKSNPIHVVDVDVVAIHNSQSHDHGATTELKVISVAKINKLGSCAAVETAVEGHLHPRAVAQHLRQLLPGARVVGALVAGGVDALALVGVVIRLARHVWNESKVGGIKLRVDNGGIGKIAVFKCHVGAIGHTLNVATGDGCIDNFATFFEDQSTPVTHSDAAAIDGAIDDVSCVGLLQ